MMLIDRFPADILRSRKFDFNVINNYFNKEIHYASKGRWALYHILKSYSKIESIALPSYLCSSLLLPCKKLGLKTEFYGFDIKDLNPSLVSFKELLKRTHVDAVLVPSMYGFAADLRAFEVVCKKNSIVMIDDKDVRKVVKSRYLEAVNARREEFAKLHRAKTSVAFGSTIRA